MGEVGGRTSPLPWIAPGSRRTTAYSNTYETSLSSAGCGLRPAARAGGAQSRGLPGSSGLRERRRELEAAGARARWRPTPGAGSCAVTIGLPELDATVRSSSLRPGPPYRLRG